MYPVGESFCADLAGGMVSVGVQPSGQGLPVGCGQVIADAVGGRTPVESLSELCCRRVFFGVRDG